ncbi:hypothetical protein LOZ66_006168 [Ophidiomyces ophidiicola]|nr:hypothetical protein LOZ66_006168 [Ophidiomyces ophidiicola]
MRIVIRTVIAVVTLLLFNTFLFAAAAGNKSGSPCTSDVDCASGCCGFKNARCAESLLDEERFGGCGFGRNHSRRHGGVRLRRGANLMPSGTGPTGAKDDERHETPTTTLSDGAAQQVRATQSLQA